MNIKKWLRKNQLEEVIDPPFRSNKIGSLMFFPQKNEMGLLSISRDSGCTKVCFHFPQNEGRGSYDQHFTYNLTDKQHEEFVEKMGDDFIDAIIVNGEA